MANVRVIHDFDISPEDYGLYYSYARRLADAGFIGKKVLYGKMSYSVFIASEDEVKAICALIPAKFISTPRVLAANDGYNENGDEQGDGAVTYPLDDTTDTAALLFSEGDETYFSRSQQLYGNIDWKGFDDIVLTWKGPTGRTLPFDATRHIEGLTTSDITFSETDVKFTCFYPHVYAAGAVYATVPTVGDVAPKVLGCAIQGKTLVCIVNNHYGGTIGFSDEVWLNNGDPVLADPTAATEEDKHPDGWYKIHSKLSGRPTQCWFFNQSGTRATQGLVEYTIDVENSSVTYTTLEDSGIEVFYDKSKTKTAYSGSSVLWSDYKGDTRVFAVVSAQGGHEFGVSTSSGVIDTLAPIYAQGSQPSLTVYMENAAQARVNLTGVVCPCDGSWSISNGTISKDGLVNLSSACGTAVVTYRCGNLYGSCEVRMSSGVWVVTSTCGSGTLGCVTEISGGTKTTECISEMCGSDCLSTTTLHNIYEGGFCYANYPGVCTAVGYDLTLHPSPCGSPVLSHVLTKTIASCGGDGSASYLNCGGGTTDVILVRARPAVIVTFKEVSRWRCL